MKTYALAIVNPDTLEPTGKYIVVYDNFEYGEGIIDQITHPIDKENVKDSMETWDRILNK